ncbi:MULTISPECIES: V-type ATP synthase subunit C [Methanoculleus]|uniref:A-type ATP synthase subunit C n=2 Tax=Methanoculleus TaxID=45989 RepID=A3CS69_METMJ|nr:MULTISPECIES: V-type ATP synthase subunit C [Methanoculleus]ABN56219.1 H+-transporting two-sector ATPase, C (AC39) subunit [Methanoculleus marisnigri JR1]MCC7556486.1 V-type ATP synthase subunit C [Methanoculleus marisnigri]UYU17689.1 V-type ATP synthase subunit C [Methanoculleus submarinus]
MAGVSSGSAQYIYACTRMRVRKSLLIPREDYLRMLNMSLPEITRFIGETIYRSEIDELGTSFSGINLVEVALSWNLAKEYQSILELVPGDLKHFTASYLRRWDIQNVVTVLRGKMQKMQPGKIKEVLVPAGRLDRVALDRLVAEESPERVAESLKGERFYPVIERELPRATETGSFAHLENELYKGYYARLIADAKGGVKGGDIFLKYIRLEIDIRNIQNLFRLRAGHVREDVRELMIPGGSFTVDELQRLSGLESQDEFIDALKRQVKMIPLLNALEEIRGKTALHEIEVALTRVQLDQMERMSKRYAFSILPILVYLEKKKYEVANLRALARGKEAGLPGERLQGYLVM